MAAVGVEAEEMFSKFEYRSVSPEFYGDFLPYNDFYKRNEIVLIILLLYFALYIK